MAAFEAVRRGPQLYPRAGDLVGAGQAGQSVAHVGRAALLVHVAQPDEHVGVAQAGAEPDLGADLADHLDVCVEGGGCVGQHVRPCFECGVVDPARFDAGGQAHPADGGVGSAVS